MLYFSLGFKVAPMNKTNPHIQDPMALTRYKAIVFIEQKMDLHNLPLVQALRVAALRPWPDENGRIYKIGSMENWWYAYKHKGFSGLCNNQRKDKGKSRSLNSEQKQWIIDEVSENPQIPFSVLFQQWKSKNLIQDFPSLNTLYRFLHEVDLNKSALKRGRLESGPTKTFETPFANDLWMVDYSPGPIIKTDDNKVIQTQLCVIIDDHSRLIPFAAYYPQANTRWFHQTLKQAVLRRGIPIKLYTDQGKPFVSGHSHLVCANLGIHLVHAPPYQGFSKGKVERVIQSIQMGFEATLKMKGNAAHSLEKLNEKLSVWIQNIYHLRKHTTTGQTPQSRFLAHQHYIRALDPNLDINRLFFDKAKRVVRKNGIIQLEGKTYEVDLSLKTLEVDLYFDPATKNPIEVWHKKRFFQNAKLVDLHLNSKRKGNQI